MAITKNSDYVGEGLARNLQQYKGKPRFEALLSSFLAEAQAVEDALWDVFIHRLIQNTGSTAPTGDLLAKLGKLVGQTSYGLSDALFLLMIRARIRVNKSQGLRFDLSRVTSLLTGGLTIWMQDIAPATVIVAPQGAVSISPYIMVDSFLRDTVSAGVRLVFIWTWDDFEDTIISGSVNTSGFASGPPVTMPDVGAEQVPGSVNFTGFAAGPPVTSDGGGVLAGVIQVNGNL